MQTLHLGLSFLGRLANNLDFAGWGLEHARAMEAYDVAGMWLVGRHPREKPTV